jgi:hypothetical protein
VGFNQQGDPRLVAEVDDALEDPDVLPEGEYVPPGVAVRADGAAPESGLELLLQATHVVGWSGPFSENLGYQIQVVFPVQSGDLLRGLFQGL